MTDKPEISCISGEALGEHIHELAKLRILVFRDYPYRYDGDMDYEERYLATHMKSPGSMIVLARLGGRIVGASSCIPLRDEVEELQEPFRRNGWDVDNLLYFGESVLLSEHRGTGIGLRFFEERERRARELGLRWCTFCNVVRPEDDPKRPSSWQPLNGFWRRRGYTEHPELETHLSWKEVGDEDESLHRMRFWLRDFGHES